MVITVYHYDMSLYTYWEGEWTDTEGAVVGGPAYPAEYIEVGSVNADDLAHAFELTNNMTGLWIDNPEVISHIENPRSSNVGDIFVDESNFVWMCTAISDPGRVATGWDQIA